MVTCALRGQLANQAFIIATTIAHALDKDDAYLFPSRSGKRDQFPNYFSHLPKCTGVYTACLYKEESFGVYKPISLDCNYLEGYFQSEKYFKHQRNDILYALDFPSYQLKQDIVAVHVRRSDYLRFAYKFNLTSIEYLLEAIDYFLNINSNFRFEFFSDDIEWCKSNFKGDRYLFNEEKDAKKSIGQIAACAHGIIGPSTFGWWGNWIADNNGDDRIVIAPKNWFNPDYKKLLDTDIVPDNWIKI